MEVKEIRAEDTYDLRHRVLRPLQTVAECKYPLDHAAIHFGAFTENRLISIVTAHPEDSPLFSESGQWRIRGMATEPEFQKTGAGHAVLHALLAWGKERGIELFWCNARELAIPFYLRQGFTVESDYFEIPGIGPHKVMAIHP